METFCSDGASACMLGRKSGISAKILEMFLNVFNLALSHCIQLPLDDAMKDVKSIIHCKFFFLKLCIYYCISLLQLP